MLTCWWLHFIQSRLTQHITVVILSTSLAGYVAGYAHEDDDVVFRGVVRGIESTQSKKAPPMM